MKNIISFKREGKKHQSLQWTYKQYTIKDMNLFYSVYDDDRWIGAHPQLFKCKSFVRKLVHEKLRSTLLGIKGDPICL